MKSLSFIVFAFLIAFPVFSQSVTQNETIKVWGNCGMCKKKIEKAANSAGASTAAWSEETKELKVSFASNTNSAKIQEAIAKAGYDTRDMTADDAAYNKLPGCCQYDRKAGEKVEAKKCCVNDTCCKADGKKCCTAATGCKSGAMKCCVEASCCKSDEKKCCADASSGKSEAKKCCVNDTCCKADGKKCCTAATGCKSGAMKCCVEASCCKSDEKKCCADASCGKSEAACKTTGCCKEKQCCKS